MSDEETLLSKGWKKKEQAAENDNYIYYRSGDERRKYYGYNLVHAMTIQEEIDCLAENGINWKVFRCPRGFGWRVMFILKNAKSYRLYSIHNTESAAKSMCDFCKKMNKSDFVELYKTEPFIWRDYSDTQRLLVYIGSVDNSYYLLNNYTDLVEVCFKFLENYYDDDNYYKPSPPTPPSLTVEETPIDFKELSEQRWTEYNESLKEYERLVENENRYRTIAKLWQKYKYSYPTEIIDSVFALKNRISLVDFRNKD